MDRGARRNAVHAVTKSQIQLKRRGPHTGVLYKGWIRVYGEICILRIFLDACGIPSIFFF